MLCTRARRMLGKKSRRSIRNTAARRNDSLRALVDAAGPNSAIDSDLPIQLELILDDYLAEENNHRHSVRQTQDSAAPLKIELF